MSLSYNDIPEYLRDAVRRIGMLSADEELDLVRRAKAGDAAANERLVLAHLPLIYREVAPIARATRVPDAGYDLLSEGLLVVSSKVGDYDESYGVRFGTFVLWWIRSALRDYAYRAHSIVRLMGSPDHRTIFSNLGRIRSRLEREGPVAPGQLEARVMRDLGVSQRTAKEAVQRLSPTAEVSLNRKLHVSKKDDLALEFGDLLVDEAPLPEDAALDAVDGRRRRDELNRVMTSVLTERERAVLMARFADEPESLHAIGARFGVSTERTRQIEMAALNKVRCVMVEGCSPVGVRGAGPAGVKRHRASRRKALQSKREMQHVEA